MNTYFYVKSTLIFRTLAETVKGFGKDTRECFRCSIKDLEFKNKDDLKTITEMYDPKDRFTPTWVKDYIDSKGKKTPEYLNFKSNFPLTIKEKHDGKETEIDDVTTVISGAKGVMLFVVKKDDETGNVSMYPSQFLLLENGKVKNAFDEF